MLDFTTATTDDVLAAAKGLGASISATEFSHRESLQKVGPLLPVPDPNVWVATDTRTAHHRSSSPLLPVQHVRQTCLVDILLRLDTNP